MRRDADHSLLFGLLALQNGSINQGALVEAFAKWRLREDRSIGDLLVAAGSMSEPRRILLEALLSAHLAVHDGSARHALASLETDKSTRQKLAQLGDSEIDSTLSRVGTRSTEHDTEADTEHVRNSSYAAGATTADGQRFRVLRPFASGGLGEVFVALDTELHREVALKRILDDRADDPASRQRFVLEAEVTGALEHPGIVPVYGLGTYGDGRPYYAMRLIKGDSLKEVIAQFHASPVDGRRSLELHKLLRRFVDVCNAIDYANSRGVLHRDIKPGNIVIGKHGETLVVDWGLAKATGRSDPLAPEGSLVPHSASGSGATLAGSALGTPAYMSPEQAAGQIDELGPRSDVYSLGATLYCLLTGKAPFQGRDVDDVIEKVKQGDFLRPRQLDPSIDRALEAVCLRAMALEPGDRYETCKALVDDVERWMADEPVTAWREPLSRRTRRWARRNRIKVAITGASLVAAVIGLSAIASVQARANSDLQRANNKTRQALDDTRKAQGETQAALLQSEDSRRQAEAVSNFLVEAFRRPDPAHDGRELKVVDLLDRAIAKLEGGFTGPDSTKGALLDALGQTFIGLGLYREAAATHAKARDVRERALGSDHPDTLRTRSNLGVALWYAGRPHDAISLHQETLKRQSAKLGPNHADTLMTRNNLVIAYYAAGRLKDAIDLGRETLALMEAKLGPDDVETLACASSLGVSYREAGRLADAIALLEPTFQRHEAKLGADHPLTLKCRHNLAVAYWASGKRLEAITLYQTNLRFMARKPGPDHPDTLVSQAGLAMAYLSLGRPRETIALLEPTLELMDKKFGRDHANTLDTRNALAVAYRDVGRLREATAIYQTVLALLEARLGPDNISTLGTRNNLAIAYLDAGRLCEALALHEATRSACETKPGPDHPLTLESRNSLATAYESFGRLADAERLERETLARRRRAVGPGDPMLMGDLLQLARNLLRQQRWQEAEALLRECVSIVEKAAPEDWSRYDILSLLGAALLGQSRYAEAEPAIIAGCTGLLERQAEIPVPLRFCLLPAAERVVQLYDRWNKPQDAAAWKAKLGLRDLPVDVWAASDS
jgi:eukaryotic-like serine/threonine-protein kinase